MLSTILAYLAGVLTPTLFARAKAYFSPKPIPDESEEDYYNRQW